MPCYTVKTTSVNLGSMNLAMLADGLLAAGYAVNFESNGIVFSKKGSYRFHKFLAGGKLEIQGEDVEGEVSAVKRAYAAQCIRATMARDWKLKESKSEKGVAFAVTSRR